MGVLLVEDDALLGEGVRLALERAGYSVTWAKDGEEALAAARTQAYSCILLDLRLPLMGGLDVLRQLRALGDRVPVIVVTANERTAQKVRSLDAGADDYLVKPFDVEEMLARVRVQIRRRDGRVTDVLTIGAVSLDLAGRTATLDQQPVALTAKEFRVLAHLMRKAGSFRSKEELEAQLYNQDSDVESNTIEVTIYALRRKLGAQFILTGRGLGYMIPR